MKKIWLLLLLLLVIFWFWVSFANPIAPETNYVCSMFENINIDNYRVVVQNGSEFYEPKVKQCSECWERHRTGYGFYFWWEVSGPTQNVFLLDKSIDVKDVTINNIESKAILIWSITSTYCGISYKDETKLYKVVKSWNNYTLQDRTEYYNLVQGMKNKLEQFPFFLLLAVVIETLVLFFIAKIFREKNEIPNKMILLWWIIPTTMTLPLLWFVLPLLLWNWTLYVIVWEILVIIVEAIIIKYWLKISWWKAIIASIICNILSFFVLSDDYDIREVGLLCCVFLVQTFALIIIGKFLRKKDEISNKKLILAWIFVPILSYALVVFVLRVLDEYFLVYYEYEEWLEFLAIWLKVILEILIIKYIRKISWKKVIITSIISNLCYLAMHFIFNYILLF